MGSCEVTALGESRHELGESIRWTRNSIHWVDIPTGQLWRCSATGNHEVVLKIDKPLGTAEPATGGRWILACGDGIAVHDGRSLQWLHRPERGKAMRMNDGGTDPAGRFLAGSMSLTGEARVGSLYRLELDGTLSTLVRGITTPNGPAFSTDGSIMYLADTRAGRIDAYDYDSETGHISNRRTFVQMDYSKGRPDGMTIDSEDHIWSAAWGAACVHRYAPTGTLVETIPVPAVQPTSCAFGGPELDELYVTSARSGLAKPTDQDGAVYLVTGTGCRGVPHPVAQAAVGA